MKKMYYLLLLLFPVLAIGQCVSGDCENGTGKYDYGFAVYEGQFKSGKPNGQGTMDYGAGEKFVGNFKNGSEDGDGKLYKNNIPTEVKYVNGKVIVRKSENNVGSNAPEVKGCLQGDCYNGFGIVQYDSGNRFEGIFKNGRIGESGKFIYKNGDYYEGKFVNELNTEGKYFYAADNITYSGTFYEDGKEKTGSYYFPVNKATVVITNGAITSVDNPAARAAAELQAESERGYACGKCGGKGMFAGSSHVQTTENYYSINNVRSDGSLYSTSSGNVGRSSTVVNVPPSKCSACNGTGRIANGGIIINTNRY